MTIKARYEKGLFKPLEEVQVGEGTRLEVSIPEGEKKRKSVREFSFAGMWKNRKDIPNGPEYVNRLRGNSMS